MREGLPERPAVEVPETPEAREESTPQELRKRLRKLIEDIVEIEGQ